jgi:hypothetical protein
MSDATEPRMVGRVPFVDRGWWSRSIAGVRRRREPRNASRPCAGPATRLRLANPDTG